MANLLRRLTTPSAGLEERDSLPLNFYDWVDFVSYQGVNYPLAGMQQTLQGANQEIGADYGGLSTHAHQGNAIVFACMAVRMLHFSEARFQFQQIRSGRPGKLFGNPDLALLENPWPNGTTGDLLARMIQDVDLSGNSFIVREGNRLARLRPDWVVIFLGSRSGRSTWVAGDGDTEVIGYGYWPGGPHSGHEIQTYSPQDVAHFAPYKDSDRVYRGMSWLTPLIKEIQGDTAMTEHKNRFLRNGATVNLIVKFNTPKEEDFLKAVSRFRENHESAANAYKTLFAATGTEVTPIGTDLAQMDFSSVQGAGELRIASAARVPPVLLGLREGLQGSSLNSGNFNASRRMFADGCIRPMWRFASAALGTILNVPSDARLWYDERDVAFLKEDLKERADVAFLRAQTIRQLVDSGFKPEDVVAAVEADDLSLLEHSGLFSVQLQQPGGAQSKPSLVGELVPATGGTANGKSNLPAVPVKPS